jgi:hypothetical protein
LDEAAQLPPPDCDVRCLAQQRIFTQPQSKRIPKSTFYNEIDNNFVNFLTLERLRQQKQLKAKPHALKVQHYEISHEKIIIDKN